MNLKHKRIGKFYLSRDLLEFDTDLAKRVMSDVLVLRCEHLYYRDEFEYYAYSELFDEVEAGFMVPEYKIEITIIGNSEDNVSNKIEFKRVN